MTKKKPEPTAEATAAEEMVRRAREQGLSLTSPDGLLKQLTKTALNQEMTGHLGHESTGGRSQRRHQAMCGTGPKPKTVLTESTGQVGIDVPRDRDGTFEPQIVKSGSGSWRASMRSCCPCMPRGLTTFSDRFPAAETY